MMRKIFALLLLLFLAFPILFTGYKTVYGEDGGRETLYIYVAGNAIYWSIESNNPVLSIPDDISPLSLSQKGVESLTITFSSVNRWRNVYNYFIEGLLYSDTGIKNVPATHAELTVAFGSEGSNNLQNAQEIARALSNLLRLRFYLIGSDGLAYKYISALDAYYIYSSFSDSFGFEFNGLFSLITQSDLTGSDYSSLRLEINTKDGGSSLVLSGMKYISKGSEEFSLSNVFPSYAFSKTREDINRSEIIFLLKDVYLRKYPESLELEYDPIDRVYILNRTISGGQSVPDLKLEYSYYYPELLIKRGFNTTIFEPGMNIEVSLEVSNIGSLPASSILVEESDWWDDYPYVTFVSGTTSVLIDNLDSGATRILRYTVKLGDDAEGYIEVPPVKATLDIMEGKRSLNYWSPSNIIYVGAGSPYIDVTLEDIVGFNINVGEEFEAYISVRNIGDAAVNDLTIADVYIGDLEPGSTKKVKLVSEASSDSQLEASYYGTVGYTFNDVTYTITTQKLPIIFTPSETLSPYITISEDINKTDSGVHVKYTIKNEGYKDIDSVVISGYIDESLEYVGNLTRVGSSLAGNIYGLGVGETKSIELNITSTSLSFPMPILSIVTSNGFGSIKYDLNAHVFTRGFTVSQTKPPEIILRGIKYNHTVTIRNLDEYPLYSVKLLVDYGGLDFENTTKSTIDILEPNSEAVINNLVWSDSTGSYNIPKLTIKYFYGGEEGEYRSEGFNITVYRGLSLNINYQGSVMEGEKAEVTIRISRDTDLIKGVNLSWVLPKGLTFQDGSEEITESIVFNGDTATLTIPITSSTPGSYEIEPPEISFEFSGKKYSISQLIGESEPIKISFRENLVMRYWIYFIPMVLLTLSSSIYLKRKLE